MSETAETDNPYSYIEAVTHSLQTGGLPFIELDEKDFNEHLVKLHSFMKEWIEDSSISPHVHIDRALATCLMCNDLCAGLWLSIFKVMTNTEDFKTKFEEDEDFSKRCAVWMKELMHDLQVRIVSAPVNLILIESQKEH